MLNLCGCEVLVADSASEATMAYEVARRAFVDSQCTLLCPDILCQDLTTGTCHAVTGGTADQGICAVP